MAGGQKDPRSQGYHEPGSAGLLKLAPASQLGRWWQALGDIGILYARDLATEKLIRLQNRIAFFAALIVGVQTIFFYRHEFYYVVVVNLFTIVAYLSCLVMNAAGGSLPSRFFFTAAAFFSITHHHLYFGYQAGFWLFLMNLTQAGFLLFPQLSTRRLFLISLATGALFSGIVVWSMDFPPLYTGMTAEVADRFFRSNVIRSPVLLVLLAYYLVDENRRTEGELAVTASKARDADEAKSFFLSNISHELRTPMTAIKGFSDILNEMANAIDDEKKRTEFRNYLNQIGISTANLTSLIDDILDFARIESGHIAFRHRDFDLAEVARNALQTAEFYGHHGHGIETRVDFDDRLPRMVKGDAARLSQILLNLAGNAMKFTHKGFVALRMQLTETTPSAYLIRFEVEDSGIGIPGDKLPYLFDRFSPVSRETAVRYGGTGLGLAISKHLVDMQGGSIAVMSSPGKGSLFIVNLWFDKADEGGGGPAHMVRDLKRARILVAEDNDVNQMLIHALLESWNADIEMVDNGLKALGFVQKGDYDLVLMDLQMPFMDGIDACEQIRNLEDAKKKRVPIIAITADVLSETRKRVFAAGMNDIVTKPISQGELYAAIQKALNRVE